MPASTTTAKGQQSNTLSYDGTAARAVLHSTFGFSSFRHLQEPVVQAVVAGRDSLTIMPTGSGKSLLYQFPVLYARDVIRKQRLKIQSTSRGRGSDDAWPGPTAVIVSPLLSLMQNQTRQLRLDGVSTASIGGSCTLGVEIDALKGKFAIVFITPESMQKWIPKLRQLHRSDERGILYFAVDECHCISSWGHDFRPSYRALSTLRASFPRVPIMALTATATQRVMNDVISSLQLKSPLITKGSFDRPNIFYKVQLKGDTPEDDFRKVFGRPVAALAAMRSAVKQRGASDAATTTAGRKRNLDATRNAISSAKTSVQLRNQRAERLQHVTPAIVYCLSRQDTENVASLLRSRFKLRCAAYHAGLDPVVRENVQEAFLVDDLQVVVATVAFGMGVHKADVRLVLHYGIPSSVEAYYQETGRAGRDGAPSRAILFFRSGDFARRRSLAAFSREPSQAGDADFVVKKANAHLTELQGYLNTTGCRRAHLVGHFGETYQRLPTATAALCCDNCANRAAAALASRDGQVPNEAEIEQLHQQEMAKASRLLLQAVVDTGSRFGSGVVIAFLRGKDSNQARLKERISMTTIRRSLVFGQGMHHSPKLWALILKANVSSKFLCAVPFRAGNSFGGRSMTFFTYQLTPQGRAFLALREDRTSLTNSKQFVWVISKELRQQLCDRARANGSHKRSSDSGGSAVGLSAAGGIDENSKRILLDARAKVARANNVAPYMVVGFQSLVELFLRRPSTLRELGQVSGFSVFKVQKYGEDFLAAVKALPSNRKGNSSSEKAAAVADSHDSQVQSQRGAEPQHKQARASAQVPEPAAGGSSSTDAVPSLKRTLSDSVLETLRTWQAHRNLRAVAQARGLRPKVVKQQLQQCERSGIATFTDPADRKKLGMPPISPSAPIAQPVQRVQNSTTAVPRLSLAKSDSSTDSRSKGASVVEGTTPTATAVAGNDDDEFSDVDIDFDEDF